MPRFRFRTVALRLLLALVGLGLAFAAGEIAVTALGTVDASGNFVFKGRVIRPHRLPLAKVAENVAALGSAEPTRVAYHEVLGWVPRPDSRSRDGLYAYNSQGIRSPVPAYAPGPAAGTLRVVLVGDSFTHCDDVPYADSWGAILEQQLRAAGQPAEVLNFGVGGYGVDQAVLRFSQEAQAYGPHVVVLGFQPENLKRNLNLLRPVYDPRTNLPFAKPRFVLADGGVELINVPVLPPERMVETLENLDGWPLRPHEYFYDPADYRGAWWQRSRLLATVADLRSAADPWLRKRIMFEEQSEEQHVGWAVFQILAAEVQAAGARLIVVHLPTLQEMELRAQLGRWPYQTFLNALDGGFELVNPEVALFAAVRSEGADAVFAGHYTRRGNELVADALRDRILAEPGAR